jgi:hypothetical protein
VILSDVPLNFVSFFLAGLACTLMATGAVASGGGRSGVHGAVTLSPSCAGAQREGDACQAPYANVELRLIADGGAVAASARTTPAGRYLLQAPAGHYRLQVMTPVKLTRCPTPDVVVSPQALSVADIDCDSGMR